MKRQAGLCAWFLDFDPRAPVGEVEKFCTKPAFVNVDERGRYSGPICREHFAALVDDDAHVSHDVTFGKGGPGGRCSTCHIDLTEAQGRAVRAYERETGLRRRRERIAEGRVFVRALRCEDTYYDMSKSGDMSRCAQWIEGACDDLEAFLRKDELPQMKEPGK